MVLSQQPGTQVFAPLLYAYFLVWKDPSQGQAESKSECGRHRGTGIVLSCRGAALTESRTQPIAALFDCRCMLLGILSFEKNLN